MLLIKDFKTKMVYTQTQKSNHLGQVLLRSCEAPNAKDDWDFY